MNGKEFIKRAKRYAKRTGQSFSVDPDHGKGGHQRVYVGNRFTTVKTGEIKAGLFAAMLKQLGIAKEDF